AQAAAAELGHGDELGRTQGGNNNAYCQDSEVSWVHWPEQGDGKAAPQEPEGGQSLLDFTRAMVWLRRDHPVFRRRRFFHGRPVQGTHDDLSDIAWYTPEGEEMTQRDWDSAQARALTVFLNGNAISEPGPRGESIHDDSFLLMFNASPEPLEFEEYSHHGMVCRYQAGAQRLPFLPLRSYAGSDLPGVNPALRKVTSPYPGPDGEPEQIYVVPPVNPDVTFIHAQRADRLGNTQI
ncbi:hypothetical protein ADL27_04700, partial [Streptomyces sp. NRRL F-6602]